MSREHCVELDRNDPLGALREQFDLPGGTIYLDGNSLGALPRSVAERVSHTVFEEWGRDLIRSWNSAGWMTLPITIGDKIGQLIGAGAGETVVADSTSVNLFKVLHAALDGTTDARRRIVVSQASNFPTDLYIADSVAKALDLTVRLVEDNDDIVTQFDDSVAAVMLTEVDYRNGHLLDMAAITAAAHAVGAPVVWDLSHSTGAVPVDVHEADADFAVGCGYKYLNGGPGAPAFVWVHPRHVEAASQPLSGWMGHCEPFEFANAYVPARDIARFQCGTPPILSLVALDCGVDTVLAAEPCGGLAALKVKADALTALFIDLVDAFADEHGLAVITPREPERRGSQVSITRPDGGYEVMQAMIEHGVIGDFRAPDIIRFGFAPLYTRFVDVWDAAQCLHDVMTSGEWRQPRFRERARVT